MSSLARRRVGAALAVLAASCAAATPARADRSGSYSQQTFYGRATVNYFVHSWVGRIVLVGAVKDTYTDGRRVRLEVGVYDRWGNEVGPRINADSTGAWTSFEFDLAPFHPTEWPHVATRLCRLYGQRGAPHDCGGWQSVYW